MLPVVGREREFDALARFVADIPSGSQVLLLSGDAGIGKTTLWRSAIDQARERGYRVLVCRPTEAEAQLPFAALADLLSSVIDEALSELAEPLRVPLEVALLRRAAEGVAPQPLAVSMATLAVIQTTAKRGPVLMAIDDAPWLDPSSAGPIAYVLQRLESEPVGVLAAQRTSFSDRTLPEVLRGLVPDRLGRMELGPMSIDELDGILRPRVRGFARPVLERIHEASGGNPFYALEIAAAIERRSLTDVDRLPIPETLAGLVRDRVAALPPEAREATLLAAALARPSLPLVRAAMNHEAADDGIRQAVAADVLRTGGDEISFSHPLLAAECYAHASDTERRDVHRRLADVVTEADERGHHLALASSQPDAGAAEEVERAAAFARDRGASGAAARLAEAATRLTPAGRGDDRHRRTIAAAEYHLIAGDSSQARAHSKGCWRSRPAARDGPKSSVSSPRYACTATTGSLRRNCSRKHFAKPAMTSGDASPRTQAWQAWHSSPNVTGPPAIATPARRSAWPRTATIRFAI
jgi:Cdc6-like AAA superfamily ATPase